MSAVSLCLSSCSTIYDYEGNCEDEVEIYIKYDYNIQRADMRPYHVGWAQVYAVDESGEVAQVKTVSEDELRDKNSVVKFTDLKPGNYTFRAVAMQRTEEELAVLENARFRVTKPVEGDNIGKLNVRLDRSATPDSEGRHSVVAPETGLDTLWMGTGINPEGIVIPEEDQQFGKVHRDTISLVRDTKYLHLILHQIDEPTNIDDSMFVVRVIDDNGHLGYDNNLLADDYLLYNSFAQWTTSMNSDGDMFYSLDGTTPVGEIVEKAAHFDISFSRLMYNALSTGKTNAVLQILNASSGAEVVRINLPYYLASGRGAYATMNYSEQEYLDREYDYHMDFFLRGGKWEYLTLHVNILPWTIRFQNILF